MELHGRNGQHGPAEISIDDTEIRTCKSCGNDTFMQLAKWGKLSPVHPANNSGQEAFIQFPFWVCANCGEVPGSKSEAESKEDE